MINQLSNNLSDHIRRVHPATLRSPSCELCQNYVRQLHARTGEFQILLEAEQEAENGGTESGGTSAGREH